jgi:hypothetical protein
MAAKKRTRQARVPATDPSLEFDLFEVIRLRLVEVFLNAGYAPIDAERIALYVVEGTRNVPRLLKTLSRPNPPPTQAEILDTLGAVLDEAPALDKAKAMLLHLDSL